MVMAQFYEIFLSPLRRVSDGRERTIAVRRGPIAVDLGLDDGERAGLLSRRHTIA
jgi:hypothetical protein